MIALGLVCVIVLLVLVQWLQLVYDSKKHNVRGPFPLPIVGNGHLLLVNATEYLGRLTSLLTQYKGAARLYLMNKRYIVLSHPKYIEGILKNPKGKAYDLGKSWLGNGLLTGSGLRWQIHRKFLTPAFHFNILQSFVPVFTRNSNILIDKLNKIADGRSVDVLPLVNLYTLDNVTETITGVSTNAQSNSESEYVKSVEVLLNIIAVRMRNVFLMSDLIFNYSPHKVKYDKALNVVKSHVKTIIEARKEQLDALDISELDGNTEFGTKNKHSFLDLMLLGDINGKKIPLEHIQEECDTFLFAGHDTTASSISFAMYSISRYPEIQRRLVAEQKEIFGDDHKREPTYNDIQEMKYLDLVIKETLRLYPAAPIIEKRTTEDMEIADVTLPKGSNLVLSLFHVHRNPEVHEEPLEFRPERHAVGNNMQPYDWIPFSAGPRNCIGQKFAMLEMKLTLSHMLRHFVLSPSDVDIKILPNIILKSSTGIQLCLKPRL